MWKSPGQCGRVGMYAKKQHSTDVCCQKEMLKMKKAI